MTALRPASEALLRAVLIDLEQVIAPELSGARAKMTLEMIRGLLSEVIMRERLLPEILRESLDRQRGQLVTAELLGVITDGQSPTHVVDAQTLNQQHDESAELLEHIVCKLIPRAQVNGTQMAAERALIQDVLRGAADTVMRLETGVAQYASFRPSVSLDIDAERFTAYLKHRFRAIDIAAVRIERILGGFSKDTFFIDLVSVNPPTGAVVLRRDNPSSPIESSVVDEFLLLERLYAAGFPVAQPLWVETSANVIGAPFMVSRRVSGISILDPSGTRVLRSPAEARLGARQFARILAQLHQIDLNTLGYPPQIVQLSAHEHIRRQVNECDCYWRARRFGPDPIMASAFQWLRNNLPQTSPAVSLVHGDASLRNLLHDGVEVAVVLDWETVHLGDPSEDLSYCRRDIEPILPWSDFLDEYYAHGGPTYHEENARFFSLWARVRNGAFSLASAVGFAHAPAPDLRFAYAGVIEHRTFLKEISDILIGSV